MWTSSHYITTQPPTYRCQFITTMTTVAAITSTTHTSSFGVHSLIHCFTGYVPVLWKGHRYKPEHWQHRKTAVKTFLMYKCTCLYSSHFWTSSAHFVQVTVHFYRYLCKTVQITVHWLYIIMYTGRQSRHSHLQYSLHKEFHKVETQFMYSISYHINVRIHLHTITTYFTCKARINTKETYVQNHRQFII